MEWDGKRGSSAIPTDAGRPVAQAHIDRRPPRLPLGTLRLAVNNDPATEE